MSADFACVGASGRGAHRPRLRAGSATVRARYPAHPRSADTAREAKRMPRLKGGAHHRDDLKRMDPPPAGPITGYMGMDVGKISTKGMAIDENVLVL